jgi:hypothetical protein
MDDMKFVKHTPHVDVASVSRNACISGGTWSVRFRAACIIRPYEWYGASMFRKSSKEHWVDTGIPVRRLYVTSEHLSKVAIASSMEEVHAVDNMSTVSTTLHDPAACKQLESTEPDVLRFSKLFAYLNAHNPQGVATGLMFELRIEFCGKVMSDATWLYKVDAVNGTKGFGLIIADLVSRKYQCVPL